MKRKKTLIFQCSSKGIGDSITGFYVALNYAHNGFRVIYHTHCLPWFEPLQLQTADRDINDITLLPYQDHGTDLFKGYETEFKSGYQFRLIRYFENAEVLQKRDSFSRFSRYVHYNISVPDTAPAVEFQDYILIAPFASVSGRQWPAANYARLCRLLAAAGEKVAFVCGVDDAPKMHSQFTGLPAKAFIGLSPKELIRRMEQCKVLVANDSGLAHVGNLYRVRTYVIMAQLPFHFVFDRLTKAPTTFGIEPETHCSPCFFQPPVHTPDCQSLGCSSLSSISVDRVLNILSGFETTGLRDLDAGQPDRIPTSFRLDKNTDL